MSPTPAPKTPFLIYGLLDPRPEKQGQTRYVGQSIQGEARPKQHCYPSSYNKANRPSEKWVKKLAGLGLKPIIVVLEYDIPDRGALDAAEVYHIRFYRDHGAADLNITDGGGGARGYKHSDETKKKMSEAQKNSLLAIAQREALNADPKQQARKRAHLAAIRADPEYQAKNRAHLAAIRASGEGKAQLAAYNASEEAQAQRAALHASPAHLRHLAALNAARSRPVVDLTTGVTYSSGSAASRTLGLSQGHLSEHLNGKSKHVKGKTFAFAPAPV